MSQNISSTDVISQEKLDEILLEIDSFYFIGILTKTSKDGYDKYKDDPEMVRALGEIDKKSETKMSEEVLLSYKK